MITDLRRGRLVVPLLAAMAATGCSSASAPPPAAPTVAVASPENAAMAAYERYWSVTDSAFTAPGSQDWTAQLRSVATGSALASVTTDVANYASYPAHQVGTATRSPKVDTVAAGRVRIVDCVDLGDSRLVADKTGAVLDDIANRAPRYRFRAEIANTTGPWLVDVTTPELDQPC